jgi:hypothetical protein
MAECILREALGFPGYFDIEGYSRYAITPKGEVINKQTGRNMVASKNPDGYYNFRLLGDTGHTLTWGRHRLLGYVFKHPGVVITNLIINHENGIKGSDYLENLKWDTYQGNAEHAGRMGLTDKCIPISVRDSVTGDITEYASIIDCARSLDMTKDAVAYRVKIGDSRVFPEKKQYRASDESKPWYIPSNVEKDLMSNTTSKPVMLRDVISGEVKSFAKLSTLAFFLRVSPSTITLWISQLNQPVLPGFVQIKWANDTTPWRDVDDQYLELERYSGKKAIKVVDTKTNEVKIFTSGVECANAMGLKPTALNHRLKSKGTVIYSDMCTYKYYSDSI